MFNTKLEVDRHVENCLRKINTELERNLRCFAFAKLYYKVGDYNSAQRYISSYLNVKSSSSEGQQLLGKILEKLGKKVEALNAYKTSLDIDPKQNSLVLKVCELMASDDVNLDQTGAKYFCELAQSFDPYNPVLFQLKARLVALESKDPNEVTQLLLKELEARPLDVDIRVRLLRHLLQHKQIKEAYNHAYDIEKKYLSIFLNSLNWYETLAEVLVCYQRENSIGNTLTWEYWMLLISVLDKLVSLSLDERSISIKNNTEFVTAVLNFDQNLRIAVDKIKSCPEKQLIAEFINHYSGQLCLHFITLLFKYARKDLIKYKEAMQISMPLLFAAYSFKPSDLESIWFQHATEGYKQQVQRWHKEAAFRCSQVGHMIMSSDRRNSVLERAKQGATGLWREHAFKKIFVTRDHQLKLKTSFFTCSEQFVDFSIQLPDNNELLKYDNVAQLVFPGSLHHYIWIGLNQELAQFNCAAFNGLNYSVKNLNNCAAESLNVLDIQSFIYCSVLCAQAQIEENKHTIYYNMEKPNVLPVSVMSMLGTANQDKWLKCAYKMFSTNQYNSDLGDVRLTLIRGIEVVRCIGNHGLDVKLLICLAKIFEERAQKLSKQSEIEFNDARAELYWKAALPLLEKLKRNQAVSYSTNRLFEYKIKELTQTEIPLNIEAAKLFMATQLMKRKDYEKALQIFETLKDPYASFHQSQIYKSLAEKETNLNKENVTSEMRSQQIILLTKARDYLYLTLDRLRNPNINKKHPLNSKLGTEIEKIERLLSRIDPDTCLNRNDECDEMSDENVSSYGSEQHYNHSYTNGMFIPRHDNTNMHSTPFRDNTRREARPSPERLDAQLRQLAASKDAAINHILDQNKIMVESQKNLVDELKSFREAVSALTITVNDLKHIRSSAEDIKHIKVSVNELKASVDELQNFKSVTDLVYEMRKEISELKKDTNKIKSNQLSDEDLYVLDEEYRTEYGSTSTNVSSLASSIYPNLGRMAPPNSSCPNPTMSYSNTGYYPPMYSMYPYNCGLPQAGALPFGAESQLSPDMRAVAMNVAQSGMNPAVVAAAAAAYQHAPLHSQAAAPPITFPPTPLQQLHNQVLPQIFKETPINPPVTNTSAANKAAPVNVVITSSDPLPTIKTSSPQIFSVTIPPQHLKGNQQKAHNYQIQLPASTTTIATTPSILSQSPMPVSTQSLLSNVAPPVFSALPDKSPNKNASLGFQIEKSLALSFNKSANDTILNRSNVSTSSQEEHDPCPDFKPIIPLPDEVPVNTGEENEEVLFRERGKLFRYVEKEWKERGVGELKLLKNPESGKIRFLMRRDQVHKICANHYLTEDMTIKQMSKNEQAYIWAANDFSEGEIVLEKFCVQFKTPELAKNFFKEFENAKQLIAKKVENKPADLGGFKFTSTPAFKPNKENPVVTSTVSQADDKKTASPFAAFSFTKDKPTDSMKTFKFESNKSKFTFTKETPTKQDKSVTDSPMFSVSLVKNVQNETKLIKENANTSSIFGNTSSTFTPVKQMDQQPADNDEGSAEDFVPTVEFQPVIPLPDLVEVKTGEEDADVLFESKAKLLRFDSDTKEWKERGVGQMKILKEKTIRLVMRREQVHKVCCNHQLLKDMEFKTMKGSSKAVSWCANDFSEGVFNIEMLAIRFKTEDITTRFLSVLNEAKEMLDDSNGVRLTDDDKAGKAAKQSEEKVKTTGFGDKFKPKTGTWECKNCYIVNEQKINHCMACETPKNDTVSKKQTDSSQFCFGIGANTTGFGDAFKPKTGSWECKSCYTRNDSTKTKCASCEIPKEGPSDSGNTGSTFKSAVDLSTGGLSFSFGMPSATQQTVAKPLVTKGFGDAFKPKAGSWECKECYTISEGNYCLSCECPKDDTIPAKEKTTKSVSLDTGGLKFNFGIQPTEATTTGTTTDPLLDNNKGFQFKVSTSNTKQANTTEEIVFGSPHKAGFDFTPRSPRRQSSGPGQEEESENSYYEDEEDNIYFKPVIPLPDKVEVTTGEEAEDVLYCHRAKLFRHVDHEWKERGIGDLKILYNAKENKLRVLMRREQIHKICLNHILTDSIAYTSKDDKTWLFSVADYSEGSYEYQNFCLRFKTAEIAKQFKQAVDEALKKSSHGDEDEADDEVEFVCETSVTAEEEAEALKLGLPPKFMSYRQLPDCECSQCKEDDDIFNTTPLKDKNTTEFSTPNSTYFGTPSGDNNSFTTIAKPEKQGSTLKDLLSKPTIFGSSVFAAKTNVTTSTSSGMFGVSDENIKSSPAKVFGGFSMNTTTAPSSNVFGTTTGNMFSSTKTGSTTIFSGSPATTLTNVFGTGSVEKTTSTVFGATTTTGNIFGGSAIFGSAAPPPTTFSGEKVFGNIAQSTTAKNVIGNGTAPTSGITFGTPTTSTMTGNLFGTPSTATGSIFGGSTNNVFGDKNTSTPITTATGSIFGGFGSTSAPPTTTNVFGTPSSTSTASVFGSSAVFNTSTSVFGTPPQTTASFSGNIFETNTASPATKSIFAGDNSTKLSFTSIINEAPSAAPKTELLFSTMIGDKNTAAFVTSGNVENPFASIGAGTQVFASQKKPPTQNKNVAEETNDDEGAEGEEYDPYYAPIVPLPDAIVVTTGEENEEVLFTHKGKLYRFDNKEWKERGVGDVKVLHNPETRTYRLLLRREVVHKIVLNQRITSNLDMQLFSKSANTWMWAGYNFCDNEMLSEKLAVRFKDEKTCTRFYETVQKAIEEVRKVESNASDFPTTIENISEVDNDEVDEEEAEDEEEVDEEEDEEDGRRVLFAKECALSEKLPSGEWVELSSVVHLEIIYDPERWISRIIAVDDTGCIHTNSVIKYTESSMRMEPDENGVICNWTSLDSDGENMIKRNLRATFDSNDSATDCYCAFEETFSYVHEE